MKTNEFNSFCPVKIISGKNCVKINSKEFSVLGKKCLIVTGKSGAKKCGALDDCIDALRKQNISYLIFDGITENPKTDECFTAAEIAKKNNVDFIFGVGGGSALDASKAVAIFAANEFESPSDIYNSNGVPALNLALIGTTCGTGSEVTGVSVLTDSDSGRKKSIHGENCYAKISFCDSTYSEKLPTDVFISTVLDAFCHALESFMSVKSNELSRVYAKKALCDIWNFLKKYSSGGFENGIDDETVAKMYTASIFAGLAINITGTCAPHTLGYMLSEKYHIPHGIACAEFETEFLKFCNKSEEYDEFFALLDTDFDKFATVFNSFIKIELNIPADEIESEKPRWSGKINSFLSSPTVFSADDAVAVYKKLFS